MWLRIAVLRSSLVIWILPKTAPNFFFSYFQKFSSHKNPLTWWPSPVNFRRNSHRFLEEIFRRISRNWVTKLKTTQKSLIVGNNSGELLENFQGISYRKWVSRNSTKKVTTVGKSGEISQFVTWNMIHYTFLKCSTKSKFAKNCYIFRLKVWIVQSASFCCKLFKEL